MKEKKWLTLNGHGKYCLGAFVKAISASDILTTQMDYLFNKDLVRHSLEYRDAKDRIEIAGHCLTDLGIETAKHYFPKWVNFDKKH